jgi:hypothetical protein
VENDRLQEKLKGSIEENEDGLLTASIPGTVEVIYRQHKGVNGLAEEDFGFLLHYSLPNVAPSNGLELSCPAEAG